MRNYWIYSIPIVGIMLVFYAQFLSPFTLTFNFADNWGYLSQIAKLREYFFGEYTADISNIASPLYTWIIFIFGFFTSDVWLLNVIFL